MNNYIWFSGIMGIVLLIGALVVSMKDIMFCERNQIRKVKYLIPNGLLLICSIGWFLLTIFLYLAIQEQI
ncbi:hypothetical protein [Enterococcus sp. DIV0187]|uniref:hypothetical protein n=1 Tax=Enterococcus sp. DIV0187 TaxID=2774644 RepID=UPI003F1EBC75